MLQIRAAILNDFTRRRTTCDHRNLPRYVEPERKGAALFNGAMRVLSANIGGETGTVLDYSFAADLMHMKKCGLSLVPIPMALLTGVLGLGTMTLLNHLIRDPGMGRGAVIIKAIARLKNAT